MADIGGSSASQVAVDAALHPDDPGALATLAAVGMLTGLPLLFPPLAASMALIAAGSALPLAQPRNVIGGHVVSALVGFTAVALIGSGVAAAAVAGAAALGAMLLLRLSHSPAVGTAVIVGATAPSVPSLPGSAGPRRPDPGGVRDGRRPAGGQAVPRLLVVTPQCSPLMTKNEPRMVPASFDRCFANLNRDASSSGTGMPSDSLNPTARFDPASRPYITLMDRPDA